MRKTLRQGLCTLCHYISDAPRSRAACCMHQINQLEKNNKQKVTGGLVVERDASNQDKNKDGNSKFPGVNPRVAIFMSSRQ